MVKRSLEITKKKKKDKVKIKRQDYKKKSKHKCFLIRFKRDNEYYMFLFSFGFFKSFENITTSSKLNVYFGCYFKLSILVTIIFSLMISYNFWLEIC